MKVSTCNAVVTTLIIMLLGVVVRAQNGCESLDGREGYCVDTTDPDSVSVCGPPRYEILEDVYRDCQFIAVNL